MSDFEAGAPCPLAMVESHPILVKRDQVTVTVYVRRRRKNTIFPVMVNKDSRHFESLSKLRPGDQMYVSSDGEDITEVIKNPLWKRLWLQMIWSL